jgi:hypothetical protein
MAGFGLGRARGLNELGNRLSGIPVSFANAHGRKVFSDCPRGLLADAKTPRNLSQCKQHDSPSILDWTFRNGFCNRRKQIISELSGNFAFRAEGECVWGAFLNFPSIGDWTFSKRFYYFRAFF